VGDDDGVALFPLLEAVQLPFPEPDEDPAEHDDEDQQA